MGSNETVIFNVIHEDLIGQEQETKFYMQEMTCYQKALRLRSINFDPTDSLHDCLDHMKISARSMVPNWNVETVKASSNQWSETVASLKRLYYQPYVFDSMSSETSFGYSFGYSYSKNLPVREQFHLVYLTEKYFTGAAMNNMVEVSSNGAMVNMYHLAKGWEAPPSYLVDSAAGWGQDWKQSYYQNGYNFHADDIYFLFGHNICKNISKPCLLFNYDNSTNAEGATVSDMELSFNLIDFILNSEFKEVPVDSTSFDASVFFTSVPEVHEDFYRDYLELHILGNEIYENVKKTTETPQCENNEAYEKWETAYEKWDADHARWAEVFEHYKGNCKLEE